MKHQLHQHPTITCPACQSKQTGVIRQAQAPLTISDQDVKLLSGQSYIQCLRSTCKYVITGNDLETVLTPIVSSPGDIRNIPNYKL